MKFFILSVCCLISFSLQAQNRIIINDSDENVSSQQKEEDRLKAKDKKVELLNVKISCPANYSEIEGYISPFNCPANGSSIDYGFIRKDSSIVIIISMIHLDSVMATIMKKARPDQKKYDPDSTWIYNYRGQQPSVSPAPTFIKPELLKKCGADVGIWFSKTCPVLLLDHYQVSRGMILSKKNYGIVEIYYFVRQNAKVDIEKEMQKNTGTLIFLKNNQRD